ncbi:hypothetical protein [Flavobacterium akiainvivens]|nr:hypothetical protein [Flavobacterium akiainvivens]SFQ73722.1 hypothetical protein SAMN05444144_11928 [Flavobacterium akiainvivens]
MLHNYGLVIEKLKAALPNIQENHDFANQAVSDFYIGKSHWKMDKRDIT